MNRGGISNSGEMTVVRLERTEYTVADDISGTVELSNPQRREITSVCLELSCWRHILIASTKKSTVEQVSP